MVDTMNIKNISNIMMLLDALGVDIDYAKDGTRSLSHINDTYDKLWKAINDAFRDNNGHYCIEIDGMWIDSTCPEFEWCSCFGRYE